MKLLCRLTDSIPVLDVMEHGVKVQLPLLLELDEKELLKLLSSSRSGVVVLHLEDE